LTDRLLHVTPEQMQVIVRLGQQLKLPEAEELTFSRLLISIAELHELQGRSGDAIAIYQRVIALGGLTNGELAVVHNGLGTVYADLGRYDEALAAYEQALALDPDDPFTHNNVAGVYLRLGRLQEAQREYEERVRLRPEDALNALVHLGIIACRQGDQEMADAYFTKALDIWDTAWERKLQPPAALLENKALALLGLNRTEEAIATLEEALDCRSPDDTIDVYDYELLASSSQPPQAIDRVLAILQSCTVSEDRAG